MIEPLYIGLCGGGGCPINDVATLVSARNISTYIHTHKILLSAGWRVWWDGGVVEGRWREKWQESKAKDMEEAELSISFWQCKEAGPPCRCSRESSLSYGIQTVCLGDIIMFG